MWFGTRTGLHKYDGYRFTVYTYDVRDTTSISSDDILCIYEDRSGALWIGTLIHGFNRFERAAGRFTRFPCDPENPNSVVNQVHSIYEDPSGMFWIGTSAGLLRFDQKQNRFTRFVHDPANAGSLSNNTARVIYEDRSGSLWIGTNNGLNLIDRTQERFTHFFHDPHSSHSLSDNGVTSINEDRSGTLWIGTYGGLNRFDREQESFTRFIHDPGNPRSLSHNVVWAIYEDRAGALWIGTEGGGLNILDRSSGQFTRIMHDPENPRSLSSNYITSIVEDRAGALWVGAGDLWRRAKGGGFGINRFDRGQNQFHHLAPDPPSRGNESEFPVHTTLGDRSGMLWIGSVYDGLYQFDRRSGRFRQFVHDPSNPRSLSQNFIMALYEDRAGTLWVGTADVGINRLESDGRTFTRFVHNPDDPHSLSHNRLSAFYEDRSGNIWIATFGGGLNRFDRQRQNFDHFLHDPDDPHSLSHNLLSFVFEDRSGILWVGTWGRGVEHFDRQRGQFRHYINDPKNPHSLSNNITWDIHEDQTGAIWIATSGGLNRFERDSGQFRYYTESDGLPDNVIHGILEDNQGNLWLASVNGLSKFDPHTETFKNYYVENGLQNAAFSFGAPGKNSSGEMFFSGRNGIDFFHPDSIKDNPYIPPVFITKFTHYTRNEPVVDEQISEKQQIELAYDDQTLTFEFVALNFRNPQKNQYAYKLEGAQEEWVYLGNQRSITFTNLAPGNYNLRVKGSNNDGVWNEDGVSLKIIIHPPWWRTWWAYALYALLALALLYSGRRYELNRQRLKHDLQIEHLEAEKLQEVDRMKSRFFASISHEFRTPLTLISGPVKQLISGEFKGDLREQYHLILRNCNRLLRLVNQLLDLSKLESGKMVLQASPQDIVALTRQLTMTFESLASVRDIKLQFNGPEEPLMVYLEREHYEKIIINLLFNALKFTPEGGSVMVYIPLGPPSKGGISASSPFEGGPRGMLEITVRDTGIGIPPADLPHIFDRFYQAGDFSTVGTLHATSLPGSGIGLALVKELVELHHGTIEVSSEVGKGSVFTVRLPLGKEHLRADEIVGGEITVGAKHPLQKAEIYTEEFAGDASPQRSRKVEMYIEEFARDASPQQPPETNETVLIVEDNPDMRAYMRGYLSEYYRLVEAEDGAQGIKQALKHAPDLIISDVMMPNMDGFQFCERIKSDERTSHIPVILLTARASGESKIEGLETGADDYLTKPFDARELRVRVSNLIEQRRRLQERFRRELVIQPSEITVTSMDETFLKKVIAAVEAHIDDPAFETDDLAREAGVSRRHLNRKLRALTGQSVREFIRTLRLKRAAQLLQQKSGTVTEIAYEVGFQSIAHFAKIFREEYGVAPSEYEGNG
ncbi:MAG: response regulator [Calditrichia bacterium]|nr:response regulator [Calditrichia bacterium]